MNDELQSAGQTDTSVGRIKLHRPKPMPHRLEIMPAGRDTNSEDGKGELGYSGRLEFGVGVRANFAVQIDFFVLRGDPFHGRSSLRRNVYLFERKQS